ncbi:MAG: hypothetical protein V1769_05970, partial [Thermoplasmatota archaeon]
YGLDPLLSTYYNITCGNGVLLPDIIGVSAPYVTLSIVLGACIWLFNIRKKKKVIVNHKMTDTSH